MESISTEENERRMYNDPAYREAVVEWLRANDVDPKDVPILARGHMRGGETNGWRLDVEQFVSMRIDPASNDREKRSITVPVKIFPTAAAVLGWLMWDGR